MIEINNKKYSSYLKKGGKYYKIEQVEVIEERNMNAIDAIKKGTFKEKIKTYKYILNMISKSSYYKGVLEEKTKNINTNYILLGVSVLISIGLFKNNNKPVIVNNYISYK